MNDAEMTQHLQISHKLMLDLIGCRRGASCEYILKSSPNGLFHNQSNFNSSQTDKISDAFTLYTHNHYLLYKYCIDSLSLTCTSDTNSV